MSAEQGADRPATNEASAQFMCLTTDKIDRYWLVSDFVLFILTSFLWIVVSLLGSGINPQVLGGVLLFNGIFCLLKTTFDLTFGHLLPHFRKKPLLLVNAKSVEFDVPQLYLDQLNPSRRLPLFGFKLQPFRRTYVTIISECHWEISPHKRRLFVTTKLPIWGPIKIRMRTEWYIPEFAVDRWVEFVSRVNSAEPG